MFGIGFSASKVKPQLKLAVSRMQNASNKKAALMKQNMREIALLLSEEPPQEEKARMRAESLIRDDNLLVAYEILQLECELLVERLKLMESSKTCPPDLVSSVSTLIYAAPFVDIPELTFVRKQFRLKYGKPFKDAAINNIKGVHQERVVSKLSFDPPDARLVETYLDCVCVRFGVNWKSNQEAALEPVFTGLKTTDEEETSKHHQMLSTKETPYVVSTGGDYSISSSVTSASTIPPPIPPPLAGNA